MWTKFEGRIPGLPGLPLSSPFGNMHDWVMWFTFCGLRDIHLLLGSVMLAVFNFSIHTEGTMEGGPLLVPNPVLVGGDEISSPFFIKKTKGIVVPGTSSGWKGDMSQ